MTSELVNEAWALYVYGMGSLFVEHGLSFSGAWALFWSMGSLLLEHGLSSGAWALCLEHGLSVWSSYMPFLL